MSYRRIIVDDKEYEYTVGKQFLKIKGVGSYRFNDAESKCSPAITPIMVERVIRNNKNES